MYNKFVPLSVLALRVLEPEEFGTHLSTLFLIIVSIHMPYAILDGYVT